MWIKNAEAVATTAARRAVVDIIEAGFDAIDTMAVLRAAVRLEEDMLTVGEKQFSLKNFKRVLVIGFGKVSCAAASALEEILGSRISDGVVIDRVSLDHKYIKSIAGTHPQPSLQNVAATEAIINLTRGISADDLVLVVVSGGGSALLCWPASECAQGEVLYTKFLGTGASIHDLNVVRKHISLLKGGGLTKLLYPATVVGLIFSDVPGDTIADVASGPTFKDETTAADARRILDTYHIDSIELTETPKDDIFFERVTNVCVVSNKTALDAMKRRAEKLGFKTTIFSSTLYDSPQQVVEQLLGALNQYDVVLGGGEPALVVTGSGGKGGRSQYLALAAVSELDQETTFAAIASDGLDNSDVAGAIVDGGTLKKMQELGLDVADRLSRFDTYTCFEATGDQFVMGQTGANVSDLMIALRTHQ